MSVVDSAGAGYRLYLDSSTEGDVPLIGEPQAINHSDSVHTPLTRPVRDDDELEESFSQADSQLLLAALEKAVVILGGQAQGEQSEETWYVCLQMCVKGVELIAVSNMIVGRDHSRVFCYNIDVPRTAGRQELAPPLHSGAFALSFESEAVTGESTRRGSKVFIVHVPTSPSWCYS